MNDFDPFDAATETQARHTLYRTARTLAEGWTTTGRCPECTVVRELHLNPVFRLVYQQARCKTCQRWFWTADGAPADAVAELDTDPNYPADIPFTATPDQVVYLRAAFDRRAAEKQPPTGAPRAQQS